VTARWIDGVLRARIGEIKPAAFAEVRDADGVAAQAEDARLLYVACTRAEDHLVVSCHGPRNASGVVRKSLLAHAIDHLRAAGGADEPATAEPARPAAASVPVPGAPERDAPVPGAEEFAARPEAAGRRSSWSATALAELLARGTAAEPPPAVPRDPLDDDGRHDELEDATGGDGFRARSRGLPDDDADLVRRPPPGTDAIAPVDTIDDQPADAALAKDPRPAGTPPDARGRYGTAVGRAVHAVLQDVDLGGDGSDVPALVDARALAEDVPARLRPAVERLTRSILASDVVARMRRSPLVRRELYVGAEVEGHVVWGYLDAVFADERGRLVVVDFKTDQAPADAELLLARYRGQLATYLLALEAATGREVGDAWLVVGRDDGAPATCLALTGAARRRAVDEVRSVLASRAGAPGPQRLPGFG
jgi:ATP-dependent exoDNAse (exonuclease V) beta subunit